MLKKNIKYECFDKIRDHRSNQKQQSSSDNEYHVCSCHENCPTCDTAVFKCLDKKIVTAAFHLWIPYCINVILDWILDTIDWMLIWRS